MSEPRKQKRRKPLQWKMWGFLNTETGDVHVSEERLRAAFRWYKNIRVLVTEIPRKPKARGGDPR